MRDLVDIVVVALLWTAGFVILNRTGTWLPITAASVGLSAYFLCRDRVLRQRLAPTASTLALGVVAAAVMIVVTYVGFALVAPAWPAFARASAGLYELLDGRHYGYLPLSLLLIPTTLGEEVIFRGRLLDAPGKTRQASVLWWIGGSFTYAAMHLGSDNATLVGIALLCGLYWSALRLWSGSLVPSMIAHTCWDLAILVVHPLVRR